MAIFKAEALVLNRFDFRETSLIVNFYTREFGKLSGLLKGIRKEPQKFASPLEPFSLNEIIFYKKNNTTLHLISHCDLKANFDAIRKDMVKVSSASIIIELLHAIMQPEDVNEEIFYLSLNILKELDVNRAADKIMMIYKIKLLALSGFKPHFDSCVCCGAKIMGHSKFSVVFGGLLCSDCSRKDLKSRTIFRGTVATILHIERNDLRNNLSLGMNPQIKKELEFILNSFLNFHLGKKLKSQGVLDNLKDFVYASK